MSTTSIIEPGSLADRVTKLLGKRPADFEVDDTDIAVEFGLHKAQVVRQLQPHATAGHLAQRTVGTVNYWSLPKRASNGHASLPAVPPPKTRKRASPIEPPDPDALTPKPYTELPPLLVGRAALGSRYQATLDRLTKPGLCIDTLDKRHISSLRKHISRRHNETLQRYAIRTRDGVVGLYRLPDAKPAATPTAAPGGKKK